MEKKKRKLKTSYKIAIMLGILSGLGICYWASLQDWDAGCPDCHYPYTARYELLYNPRTLNDDVLNGVSDVFYQSSLNYKIKWLLRDNLFLPQTSIAFTDKLPEVIFDELFDDDLSGWTFSSIEYLFLMNGMEIDNIRSVKYRYQRPCIYNEIRTYCIRSIEYSIAAYKIDVHDYVWGPRSSAATVYQEPTYISLEEALQIASERGGRQFVENNSLENYPLRIGRSVDEWYVEYNFDSVGSTPSFHLRMDAITGERK